jgi:hypothetical protein
VLAWCELSSAWRRDSIPLVTPVDLCSVIIGAADFTVDIGGFAFGGIGVGCICAVVLLPLGELAYKAINGDRPPPSSPYTGH